ncbi:hypothetical protein BDA99DRAFT_583662 [Phascolomyces articulosus]|uniref:Uncharacterized protein n=1 Tax=Phascolomyces articulosus TaxID=60185 RepID=A0AAD5JWL8_9FUNG|nr:hypothetical protein BDA99DRAFT_583662 [Phascolomyces articulosus]
MFAFTPLQFSYLLFPKFVFMLVLFSLLSVSLTLVIFTSGERDLHGRIRELSGNKRPSVRALDTFSSVGKFSSKIILGPSLVWSPPQLEGYCVLRREINLVAFLSEWSLEGSVSMKLQTVVQSFRYAALMSLVVFVQPSHMTCEGYLTALNRVEKQYASDRPLDLHVVQSNQEHNPIEDKRHTEFVQCLNKWSKGF